MQMKNSLFLFGGLLLALPLVGCGSNNSGPKESGPKESGPKEWETTYSGQEALAQFNNLLDALAQKGSFIVTNRVDYDETSYDILTENITGTSDYMETLLHNEEEGTQIYKTWAYVEGGEYYLASLEHGEEVGTLYKDESQYRSGYRAYLMVLEVQNWYKNFEFIEKGKTEKIDGETVTSVSFTFKEMSGEDYTLVEGQTDGTLILNCESVSHYNGRSHNPSKFEFDYDSPVEFELPDLTGWNVD